MYSLLVDVGNLSVRLHWCCCGSSRLYEAENWRKGQLGISNGEGVAHVVAASHDALSSMNAAARAVSLCMRVQRYSPRKSAPRISSVDSSIVGCWWVPWRSSVGVDQLSLSRADYTLRSPGVLQCSSQLTPGCKVRIRGNRGN